MISNPYEDYHVHSEYSDDSVYPVELIIKDAIQMGMSEICFTDHVDYGIKRDWDDPRGMEYRRQEDGGDPFANVDYPKYISKLQALQKACNDKIRVKIGLEFGIQMHTIPAYEKLFFRYPFDFIILSIHQVEDKEFWTQDFQNGRTQDEYNLRYYEEMLQVIDNYKNYSVLGHMDLIARYDTCGSYPFSKIKPIITQILQKVISDGKGIEVNTSSHRYGLSDLTPSRDILRLYKNLGGKIITIGSDSHKPEHLGKYISETKEELLELGFEYYCTFNKMKPIFHRL